jgi:hypothetical protein
MNPRARRDLILSPDAPWPCVADLEMTGDRWSSQVVGKISHWIDVGSSDPHFKYNSELVCALLSLFAVRLVPSCIPHFLFAVFASDCVSVLFQILRQELSLAFHLTLCAVCLPPPTPANCVNLARIVTQLIPTLPATMQLWVPFSFGTNVQA